MSRPDTITRILCPTFAGSGYDPKPFRSPLAGIMNSLFLLIFMLVAAKLASYIPLAALAAVLVVVS